MMGYSILSLLFAWTMPTKKDRQAFRNICKRIDSRNEAKIIKKRYEKVLSKLKTKNKIRVMFLVNENSKWKAQSLYDLMQTTNDFEPIIGLTIADTQKKLAIAEKESILKQNQDFFEKKGMQVIVAYDSIKNKAIDLKKFDVDIVFYQQPYSIPRIQDINSVSKFALTCYIPYYLPDYINFALDCDKEFHHKIFRFYVLNKELEDIYTRHLKQYSFDTENIKGLGHTTLDCIKTNTSSDNNQKIIIYAPHWSIYHPKNQNNINISTFDTTGKAILEYAQRHTEIQWVFKPHPTLKTALKRIGESEENIANYYNEWEKFAICCYNSEYLELFSKSTAMITDCGSFLLEYFCTGKPLIHLISQNCDNVPYPQMQEVFNTFYQALNPSELFDILDNLLVDNFDDKKNQRFEVLNKYKFNNNNAAQNILNDLKSTIKGESL